MSGQLGPPRRGTQRLPRGRVVRCWRLAGSASEDRTALPCRGCHVIQRERPQSFPGMSTPVLGRLRCLEPRSRPPTGRCDHGSAGIRKTPTGRYEVWWRLDDASQGSQTFDTRDQARDFKHDLLARLAHGNSVDLRVGRQTFEAWAREWWEGWSANPDHSPRTLQAAEARLRRHLRRLGLSDDGEAWLAASAAARAREARWIAREERRTGTIAA
jgi:hypothetical protein